MTIPLAITTDDLICLVAGTLSEEDFLRVAAAVKHDIELQAQLVALENIRQSLVQSMSVAQNPAQAQTIATRVLQRVEAAQTNQSTSAKPVAAERWPQRLRSFFSTQPRSAQWAYGLVLVQALGITYLMSGTLQPADELASGPRSAGPHSKQLGVVPGSVVISVSFEAATPESSIRGLLLELEAQIIAGPSQLGQYKIVVAGNRSALAFQLLKEAAFVVQAIEVQARPKNFSEPVSAPPSDAPGDVTRNNNGGQK